MIITLKCSWYDIILNCSEHWRKSSIQEWLNCILINWLTELLNLLRRCLNLNWLKNSLPLLQKCQFWFYSRPMSLISTFRYSLSEVICPILLKIDRPLLLAYECTEIRCHSLGSLLTFKLKSVWFCVLINILLKIKI